MANDENNNDRAMMRPPDTAVRRVLLCRHSDTETGDNNIETQVQSGDSQSESDKYCVTIEANMVVFLFLFSQLSYQRHNSSARLVSLDI